MITERHLEALKRLLPGHRVKDGGGLAARIKFTPLESAVSYCTMFTQDTDFLIGEIQRALLKQEDARCVCPRCDVRLDEDGKPVGYLWIVTIVMGLGSFGGNDPDLLAALLEANALYWEAKEDVKDA